MKTRVLINVNGGGGKYPINKKYTSSYRKKGGCE